MKPKKLIKRLLAGHLQNVAFSDFVQLVEAIGYVQDHTRGSHRFFHHAALNEPLNLQERNGEAKPYQIRQVLKIIEKYRLIVVGGDEE
jgi:predicted RNA binding protein YcfA (HicA-like mRNA interferase family)